MIRQFKGSEGVVCIMNLHENQILIESYSASLRGKTDSTVDVYIRIIQQFLTWLTTKPGGSDGFEPNQLTRTAVEAYLSDLEQRRTSISHRSRVKTVIGNFADWLIETNDLQKKNP